MTNNEVRALVCPDSFKGTYSAAEVAGAVSAGLREEGVVPDPCPAADGGEGTLDVLLAARGGRSVGVVVRDPLGRDVRAALGLLPDGVAVVEVAQASGLGLLEENERAPLTASSYGTGQLIAEAVRRGAREVLIAAGGSATCDGGAGMLTALQQSGGTGATKLTVLCDVITSYEDSARIFAPQKGATAGEVATLSGRLHATASRLPRDPRNTPRTGAAGGMAGALWSVYGAALVPGADHVLRALGLDRRLDAARLVVTGEGRADHQTFEGKLVAHVARYARNHGVPVALVVGRNDLTDGQRRRLGVTAVYEASDLDLMISAGRRLARALRAGRPRTTEWSAR